MLNSIVWCEAMQYVSNEFSERDYYMAAAIRIVRSKRLFCSEPDISQFWIEDGKKLIDRRLDLFFQFGYILNLFLQLLAIWELTCKNIKNVRAREDLDRRPSRDDWRERRQIVFTFSKRF